MTLFIFSKKNKAPVTGLGISIPANGGIRLSPDYKDRIFFTSVLDEFNFHHLRQTW